MTNEEAIKYLLSYDDEDVFTPRCVEAHRMAINALREKTGEWICRNGKSWDGLYYCTKCGKSSHTKDNYCSRCGAFMGGSPHANTEV